jgi:hypothetical protein
VSSQCEHEDDRGHAGRGSDRADHPPRGVTTPRSTRRVVVATLLDALAKIIRRVKRTDALEQF